MISSARFELSLVISVYNELATLKEIIQRVVAVDPDKGLVVVDDFSTDGSREAVAELREGGLDRWLARPRTSAPRTRCASTCNPTTWASLIREKKGMI